MPTDSNADTDSDPLDWRSEASSVEMSLGDRLRETYEKRIYQPALVAWDDIRTRIGFMIVSFYLLVALVKILGLWRNPEVSQARRYLSPFKNWAYPLGTTRAGIDLLALMIDSTPFILLMVLAGGVWATSIAVAIGTVAGYKGGTVDSVIMSVSDFFMAIPGLPLVIILAMAISPENPIFVGVILTINYWAGVARAIRSQVLSIREENYVEASRTMGTSTPRIIFKDILPNIMPYVLVQFVLAARYTIFASIGLYFLGVLPYTGQNWGVTLNYAYNSGAMFSLENAHWIVVPMVAIVGLTLGLTLLGQGLDRVFNPRVRTRLAGESESVEEQGGEATSAGMV